MREARIGWIHRIENVRVSAEGVDCTVQKRTGVETGVFKKQGERATITNNFIYLVTVFNKKYKKKVEMKMRFSLGITIYTNISFVMTQQTDDNRNQKNGNEPGGQDRLITVSHAHSLPGHTGYITIATLPPFGTMAC